MSPKLKSVPNFALGALLWLLASAPALAAITPADPANPAPLQAMAAPSSPRPVAAHPGPTQSGISVVEALALALKHNRSLQAARQSLEGAKASLAAAEATRIPRLEAQVQGQSAGGPPNGTALLNLNYDLDTHGLRAATIALSQQQMAIAELELLRTAQSVRLQVLSAYFELVESQEQERIYRQMTAYAEQSLADAQALRRVGESTTLDLQRAQVQVGQQRQGWANATAARLGAGFGLARALGLDPSTPLVAVDAVVKRPDWPHTPAASVALGLQRRPEMALLRRQVTSAELQVRQARSAYGLQTQVGAGAGGTFAYLPPLQSGPALSANGQASLLLVDGGAAANQARAAEWAAEATRTRLSDQELQIRMEILQSQAQLKAAEQNIATATVALRVARDGVEAARLRFQGGVGTQTDVLLTQDDLELAEGALLSAVISYNRAHAQLEQMALAVGLDPTTNGER